MKTNISKTRKSAFSLIELSIVILIVSILVAGSLTISKSSINSSKKSVTKERMDEIYKALTNFVAINRRLPCPALLTVAKGAITYGDEAATVGTCSSTYVSSATDSSNLVYGMVPIKALGLEIDMAEDGWGTKFSYVVDKRFTEASVGSADTNGFEITQAIVPEIGTAIATALIDVQGPSGTSLLTDENALFVLISHGANKYTGFNASSTAQTDTDGVTDELDNDCNGGATSTACSTTSAARYDNEFIVYSTDPDFDDIVIYANKPKLLRDAGLEYVMCNAAEAKTASYTWTTNGNYGCSVCSGTANYAKQCGKYGIWGAVVGVACTADAEICPNKTYEPDMVIYTDKKDSTTAGGTCTSGAWRTRTLDTIRYEKDDSESFSLSSNQITLQTGKYYVEAEATSIALDRNTIIFYNISDGATDIQGDSSYSNSSSTTGGGMARLAGVVDISSAKIFELQHQCSNTQSTNGFGAHTTFTTDNYYITITKTKRTILSRPRRYQEGNSKNNLGNSNKTGKKTHWEYQ
jgi:prepilin-type N-terminal cleavage/methylation domain-containing protein